MGTRDDEWATDEPVLFDWAAHRRAMVLAAGAALLALVIVYADRTGTVREATVTAFEVQLLVMSLVLPAAAVGGQSRLDVLCRGGTVNDAFGAGLIGMAAITSELTMGEAFKLYLLVSAVGLACLGLYWWVREATGRRRVAALAAAGLGAAVWTGMVWAPALRRDVGTTLSGAERMMANADLHGAVASSLGLAESPSPWYGVLLVYAALAGLVWTGPLLSIPRPDRRDSAGGSDARDET